MEGKRFWRRKGMNGSEFYIDLPALRKESACFYDLEKNMKEYQTALQNSEKYLQYNLSGGSEICKKLQQIQADMEEHRADLLKMGQTLAVICEQYRACEETIAETHIEFITSEDTPWYKTKDSEFEVGAAAGGMMLSNTATESVGKRVSKATEYGIKVGSDAVEGAVEGTDNLRSLSLMVDENTWYSPSTKNQIDRKTGKVDYIGRYPKAYIDGIIKAYETHKKVNGRFVLDNAGQTIGYGHDLSPGENFSGGLSTQEALDLLIEDLDKKYVSLGGYIKTLNSEYGYNIDINNFSENEKMFLVDFAFNRGAGLVKRPQLKAAGKPYSSLAILITAVSEKNDQKIIDTLMEETKNKEEVYYEGLKLRRMDQYEIYKFGDYVRDYDVKRKCTK